MRLKDVAEEVHVMWDATPQGVLRGVATTIRSQEDYEASQRRDRQFVGTGYFYVDVRNMRADLALMHSAQAGYWTADFIEQDVISESELVRAVEEACGAINKSGHYPLPEELKERLLYVLKHNL